MDVSPCNLREFDVQNLHQYSPYTPTLDKKEELLKKN